MTQEEKAKAYDEALEKLRSLYDDYDTVSTLIDIKEELEHIFPELKESEDERIRKHIIEVFRDHFNGEDCDKCIAWLEKQKTSEEALQYLRENHSPSEVNDFQATMNIAVAKAYDKGYNDALEKQAEQKSTLPKWKYKKDHTPLLRDSLILNKYGCVAKSPSGALVSDVWVIDYAELAKLPKEVEKQGEQKPTEEYNITGISSNKSQGKLGEIIKNLKTTWSEEDEKCIRFSIDIINRALHAGFCVQLDRDRCVNWLKSLRPQSNRRKELLAAPDLENALCNIQDRLSDTSYEYKMLGEAIEFIRCTETKSQWKPSDEQMKQLGWVVVQNKDNMIGKELMTLYNDLEKLKG